MKISREQKEVETDIKQAIELLKKMGIVGGEGWGINVIEVAKMIQLEKLKK